jgi:hypothetical protein
MVNIMTWYGGMVKLFLVDKGCHLSRSLCKTDFKFMLSEFATEPTDPPILNNPWSTSVLYISYFENNDLFIYIVTFWKLELSARFKACIDHRIAASCLRVSVWKGCPTHPFFYTRPTRPFFYPSFYNNHAVTIATSESLTLSPVSLLYYIWCQKKERILFYDIPPGADIIIASKICQTSSSSITPSCFKYKGSKARRFLYKTSHPSVKMASKIRPYFYFLLQLIMKFILSNKYP